MIDIRITAKGFEHPLLENIGITLNAGELVALVGPSGCGKTTLLNIIAGLDQAFSGVVRCSSGPPRTAFMFQEPRLLPWRTLRQNLEIIRPDTQAIDRLLHVVGLWDQQHKFPSQVSLGMARRIALLRCFLVEPELLLMDEPLVSLDEASARIIRQQLAQQRAAQPSLTVLYVTHDLEDACAMADRIIVLGDSPTRILAELRAAKPEQIRRLFSDGHPVAD